jgi:hypothetical protein
MDAETNPKAKMTTTIRYVHRKRISERFSGKGDETVAEKVDGPLGALRQAFPTHDNAYRKAKPQ